MRGAAFRVAVVVMLAMVGLWSSARADTIYKCVRQGKPASYQHEPCGGADRTASVHQYRPEPARPPPALTRQAPSRPSARRMRTVSVRSAAGGGKGCQHTKDARDAWERRVGLGRTYESLQVWNDRVREACR